MGHPGLDLLLDLLISMSSKHQQDGSAALYKLANKAAALSPMDAAPPSPTPQVCKRIIKFKFTLYYVCCLSCSDFMIWLDDWVY